MRQPGYITLPIILVLLAIGYLYYATVFVVIDGWLGLGTAAGLANAAVFSGLAVICVGTYVTAVRRDPGNVPSSYTPDIEDPGVSIHEIKRKSGDLRYCQKCSHYKPPRAHHCRVCKRCILKMDHHCIWINNCVGHGNYKVFFVFLLHAVIACTHSMVLLVGSTAHDFHGDQLLTEGSSRISYNKTTIEYHEGVRAMGLAQENGNDYQHPYDLGVYENLVSILGPSIWCWICPAAGHIGSGLHFRTVYDLRLPRAPR